MKKFQTLVLGLASVAMLASCAKDISAEEAKKIASEWNASLNDYKGVTTTVKDSDGKTQTSSSNEYVPAAALVSRSASQAAIAAAAEDTNSKFKADGTALEFSYKNEDGDCLYKTNADGLATYLKVTTKDGWVETVTTWTK